MHGQVESCTQRQRGETPKSLQKTSGTINVGARGLTSQAGIQAWEADKAQCAEKARKKADATQWQEEQETAHITAHAAHGPTTVFSSALSSKSKADLLEQAQALGISLENAWNNGDQCECIQAHLNNNPALKTDPKFAGLYGHTRGQKCAHPTSMMASNENIPPDVEFSMHPPAMCQRLDVDGHWQPLNDATEMNQPIAGPSRIPIATHGTNEDNLLTSNDANHDVCGNILPHYPSNHHFYMFPYHHTD
ncbi:uncharacterized protein BJ212DRAFT_1368210 [Suillus subaureus]|uniref:Uncharacterized protein n=1 Tax=Suillus subaureus TaxID=48587 RepID=A0A9P7E6K6_9AGAM|nr:uncharacterized protein BJ212DRAFT_1368210 [Suillus subaureus]KAG1812774.1 hypothetical protein BJ212DRAFT_1368210 [Suillus subaureus]